MSTTTPPPNGPEGPEYLEPAGGEPVGRGGSGAGGGRTALIGGAAVLALAAVGGGVWAAMSFFTTGAQPAEALPDSTLGYSSLDLDPGGEQKIEAFRMLDKFPAFREELGIDADDDIKAKVFEDLDEGCEGVTYADDVEPWLGDRFAVAAVDLGEEMPTPVGVVQVTDGGAAEDGLAALAECAGGEVGGWSVQGEWAIVAETTGIAEQVADATGDGSLADDESFRDWTGEVGDPGVMTMYAAPGAGKFLARMAGSLVSPYGMMGMPGQMPLDDLGVPPEETTPEVPEELTRALEDFQGMAATVRFDDGALELEAAGAAGSDQVAPFAGDRAADTVTTLPGDTAVALGFGLPEGWLTQALEQAERFSDGGMSVDDMLAQLEAETGLTVADFETLAGDSAAFALGGDFDAESFFGSSDGSDVPFGVKVLGDPDAINDVLDRLEGTLGSEASALGHDSEGEMVAIGPNPDYRQPLLEEGDLGDSEVFGNVVREADDAASIFYVNFDAGDWLTGLAAGDQTARENLEPLQGVGASSWVEDDASHLVFRLTTN